MKFRRAKSITICLFLFEDIPHADTLKEIIFNLGILPNKKYIEGKIVLLRMLCEKLLLKFFTVYLKRFLHIQINVVYTWI